VIRSIGRRLATPLALAAIVALAPSASAGTNGTFAALPRPAFGAHVHAVWPQYTDAQRRAVIAELAAGGVRWLRIDMMWSFAEPSPGADDPVTYHRLDVALDEAQRHGMSALVVVFGTPNWANGGRGTVAPPTDPAAFESFAERLAQRYRGRVAAWEVWNEPNWPRFWSGSVDDYVALLKAAYRAFKAGDPAAQVVFGGLAGNDVPWIRRAYDLGAKGSFDALATHVYTGPSDAPPENDWNYAAIAAVRAEMVRRNDGATPIWLTEFGWSAHPNTGGEGPGERGVTEEQQADYLERALELAGSRYPYVTHMFWYMERDVSYWNAHEDSFGLLRNDLSHKPAFEAVRSILATPAPARVTESSLPAVPLGSAHQLAA
jgi:GH35 family endo-1,4-beta-xylanase